MLGQCVRGCVRTVCKSIGHNSDRRQQPDISDTSWCRGASSTLLFQQFALELRTHFFSFLCSTESAGGGASRAVEKCEMC